MGLLVLVSEILVCEDEPSLLALNALVGPRVGSQRPLAEERLVNKSRVHRLQVGPMSHWRWPTQPSGPLVSTCCCWWWCFNSESNSSRNHCLSLTSNKSTSRAERALWGGLLVSLKIETYFQLREDPVLQTHWRSLWWSRCRWCQMELLPRTTKIEEGNISYLLLWKIENRNWPCERPRLETHLGFNGGLNVGGTG